MTDLLVPDPQLLELRTAPILGRDWIVREFDDDQQYAFGWANMFLRADGTVPNDAHGDRMDGPGQIAAFEDAVYRYNLFSRSADDGHKRFGVGNLIESFVSTPEKLFRMGIPEDAMPLGWWAGFHIPDESLWRDVRSGKKRMLSIVAKARLIPHAE